MHMANLSELVKQDYDAEVEIIRETGELWLTGIVIAILAIVMWGLGLLFNDHWSKGDIVFAIIFVIAGPFVNRAWDRHKITKEMRHQREIRVEVKLNALLGLVKIEEG